MARRRERIPLEHGLKLEVNSLVRQGLKRACPFVVGSITFSPRGAGEAAATGIITLRFSNAASGSLSISLGSLEQRIELVAVPRHFGGSQWYFVCPVLGRRASFLWMPPGASHFASRQAWGNEVAYRSQSLAPPFRALSRAQEIRIRLGGEDYIRVFHDVTPPKPKGMHRRTYEAQLKRLEAYENKCDLYELGLISCPVEK
jgi:hypothetical protein